MLKVILCWVGSKLMNSVLEFLLIFACICVSAYLLQWFKASGKVEVIGAGRKPVAFLKGKENSLRYYANLKYGLSGKLNMYAAFTQNKKRIPFERETFYGTDGGEFCVDWYSSLSESKKASNVPIIFFVHGINGSSRDCYLQKCAMRLVHEKHWRACCYIYRGNAGHKLTTPKPPNAGYTEDIHIALKAICERNPEAPVAMVGYSLGGNIVAKYLGELKSKNRPKCVYKQVADNDPVPKNVCCAVVVGNPGDLYHSNMTLSFKDQCFYGGGLAKMVKKQENVLKSLPSFTEYENRLKSNPKDTRICLYDQYFTTPVYGYNDYADFYRDGSSNRYLDGVQIPLLFINYKNDPASVFSGFPRKQIEDNPNIAAIVLPGGGHLGAFYATTTKRAFDEDLVVAMLSDNLPSVEVNNNEEENKKEQ